MNIPLKTKVKYWVYFLRLCHKINDPVIQENLKKSKSLYKRWGNYQTGSYETWWKEHAHLFSSNDSIEIFDGKNPLEKDSLYLKIPLRLSPTSVSRWVQRIYKEEHDKRIVKDGKVKKVYGGVFQLSTTDFQTSQFDYYHRFTKDVYIFLMNQGITKTKEYIKRSEEVFQQQRKVSSKSKDKIDRKIPFKESSNLYENLSRLTRRYKIYSRNLLMNVSQGIFPGEYEEVGIKNQVEKRKKIPKVIKTTPRGPYQKRIQKKSGLVQKGMWIDKRNK